MPPACACIVMSVVMTATLHPRTCMRILGCNAAVIFLLIVPVERVFGDGCRRRRNEEARRSSVARYTDSINHILRYSYTTNYGKHCLRFLRRFLSILTAVPIIISIQLATHADTSYKFSAILYFMNIN